VSKLDRIKEELGWLKVVLAASIAIDVSLIAWLAQNFETASSTLLMLALIGVLAASTGIIVVSHAAYKRILQLENL